MKRAKIVVAMSGGVDSSVAAALLKEQGFEVVGIMLRLWSEPGKEGSNRCCTPESMALARRAAAILDMPFYVVDAKQVFRETVVETFLEGYGRGETPNPCLECNRYVRWTVLLQHALALGAEFMATGHYARLVNDERGIVQLLRGADPEKDQSYVLHVLNQGQLRQALFPLGAFRKAEVRAMAERYGLPTATRHDSQDLCFLAGGDYRDFLRRNRPELMVPGQIVDRNGTLLGTHDGLANYTIGQRKGLNLGSSVPLYVLGKEAAGNRLVVGTKAELGRDSLSTGPVNWPGGESRAEPFRAQIKTRYTAAQQPGLVTPVKGGRHVQIRFDEPQRDITPGQAAVFYDEDVVIGGGLIQ